MRMNFVRAALVTAATAGWIGCQDPGGATPPVVRPPAVPDAAGPSSRSVGDWIEQLGAARYDEREAAGRALESLGSAAVEALRDAAESHADVDVRLRARRVLQRIEAGEDRAIPGGEGLRRLEPRDPVTPQPFDGGDRRRRVSPFEDLETLFRDGLGPDVDALRRQMDELRRQLDAGIRLPGFDGLPGTGSGTSIAITPDGVRVEVQETDEDGKPTREVYEAPDLETLRREHPELADRLPLGLSDGLQRATPWSGGIPEPWSGLRPVPLPGAMDVDLAPPGPGEVLGVRVEVLDPALSDYLELEQGLGLLVRAVEPDSLAAAAGLKVRDVVLSVGGVPIRTVADVRSALRSIAAGEPVVVEVNRFGQILRLETAKRHDAPRVEPEARQDSGGLRRRD